MSNTNCLEGIRCPKCGQEDRFFINGVAQFEVTDEGSDTVGDHEWGDESWTRCPDCEHTGNLKDFRVDTQLPPDPDGQNADRATWAEHALVAFESQTGSDRDSLLGDLLCDLMHWCDRNNFGFSATLGDMRVFSGGFADWHRIFSAS